MTGDRTTTPPEPTPTEGPLSGVKARRASTHSVAVGVWAAAMAVYVCAVAARSSLGVAGVEAMGRFDMSAATLALFSTLQLGVYAVAQIPVGVALDRFGPRRMLVAGGLLVAAAQVAMALVGTVPEALAARVALGVGDATAFVSVLRLLPSWFPSSRVPVFTQLTSIIGMTGQVISAIPFVALLHGRDWTTAFLTMAAVGAAAAGLALVLVRDGPAGAAAAAPTMAAAPATAGADGGVGGVLGSPWTWLGFFTHWLGAGPTMTFALLWGVPFMTLGMGLSSARASAALVLNACAAVVFGPVVGHLTARWPRGRLAGVLATAVATALAWAAALGPARPGPSWMAGVLAIVLAASSVSSSVAFDFIREGTPERRLGTAIATANMGGFVATLVSVQLIGLVLDAQAPDGSFGWDVFRAAMAVQAAPWVIGVGGVLASWGLIRRRRRRDRDPVAPRRPSVAGGRRP